MPTEEQKAATARKQAERRAELSEAYATGSLFHCLDDVRQAKEPTTYWGNWIVKNSLILFSGFGGISKTTFLYRLLTDLMDKGEFLTVSGHKALTVLYLDLESDASLIKARMRLLGNLDTNHPNFEYCNFPGITLKEMKPYVDKFRQTRFKPDIIVLDPLSLAFPSYNENDNAEATKQFAYIREVMRHWQTTMILVSHSGKADIYGVGHNRGASARPNLADITWNFHSMGKEYGDDKFIFDIPKNRWIQDSFFECVEKQEGEFAVVPFPDGFQLPKANIGVKSFHLQEQIYLILATSKEPIERKSLMDALEIEGHSPEAVSFHRAIQALVSRGQAVKVGRGVYRCN